jgi:hypothetical protein
MMALLRHHFIERSQTWLAGFRSPKASPALRALPLLVSDAASLAAAMAFYGGNRVPTDAEFLSLTWLESFARSGRQLLVCHAMRLLEAWMAKRRVSGSLGDETAILNRLSLSAGQCANLLPADQLALHSTALHNQIQRVLRLKALTPKDLRSKAMALFQAADVLQQGEAVRAEARALLDQALPLLIASDGGPLLDDIVTHIRMVQDFLSRPDLTLAEASRNALDRARPFLAMLLTPTDTYDIRDAPAPIDAVRQTAPLRYAPQSHVARLQVGKTVALAMPAQGENSTCFSLFTNQHFLCKAGLFRHAPDDATETLSMTSDASDNGQWLQHTTPLQQRTVYMAAAGDDLRIEDHIAAVAKPAWMRLTLPDTAKISVARNGTQATIALDARNLWQLSLRGGVLLAPDDGHQWLVKSSGPCVNWALKRIAKPATKQQRENLPELPF